MKIAAILFIAVFSLSAGEPVLLRDDVNVVPAAQWRYDELVLKNQLPATVDCTFTGNPAVRIRLELMTHDNLESMKHGGEHESIAVSTRGRLRQEIGVPGEYAIAVVNEDREKASHVALRVTVAFSAVSQAGPRYLSPERKLSVILLSFLGFLTILTLSARKLLLAMRKP